MTTKQTPTTSKNSFSFDTEDVILTPGRYLVVDPCYVVPNEMWSDFCGASFVNHAATRASFDGISFFCQGTAHGDGCFVLKCGNKTVGECGVDAGLLSIIPETLIQLWNSEKNYDGMWPNMGGVWVEIKENTPVHYGDGNFSFGAFRMKTD
jgi:hypothetical protein